MCVYVCVWVQLSAGWELIRVLAMELKHGGTMTHTEDTAGISNMAVVMATKTSSPLTKIAKRPVYRSKLNVSVCTY